MTHLIEDQIKHMLDDMEVDGNGLCRWTEVANALQHIKACIEPALSSVRVDAWQPISSAPKDGTCVWIFVPEYEPNEYVASFGSTADLPKDHEDYWEGWIFADEILVNHCADELEPTHWMPRPAPPMPEDLSDGHLNATDQGITK